MPGRALVRIDVPDLLAGAVVSCGADHAGTHGFSLALELKFDGGGRRPSSRDLGAHPLGHHELAGGRAALQPGGRVDDIADGGEVFNITAPDVADRRNATVDADA